MSVLSPNDTVPIALTSVGMLVRLGADRFLFQLRDDIDGIAMPGRWGVFGGHVEPGESWEAAAVRELAEEIELAARQIAYVTEVAYPRLESTGRAIWARRVFFDCPIAEAELKDMRLHEGAGMKVMSAAEYLATENIIPWDAFAVVHATRMPDARTPARGVRP